MKKLAMFIMVLGFAVQGWGQELPQYRVVTKVEAKKDTMYVSGFEKESGVYTEAEWPMEHYNVYTNRTTKFFPTVSLVTVPFKIRPKSGDLSSSAYSDLKNIGVNVDFYSVKWDRYFATGKTSTHRASGGLLVAPLVEELTEDNTIDGIANDKQLFWSLGFALNYSYNKLTFTFIPIGFDIAHHSSGKQWVYNRKYWWGFGIGVDLKILEGLYKE